MTTFSDLIDKGASADDIASHLDGLPEPERIAQVRGLSGAHQKKLWKLVEGAPPMKLADFVKDAGKTVIYAGRNSLPAFNLFEKRFFRPTDGGDVVGYNHQKMSALTGPGYFVTEDGDNGELVFDYVKEAKLRPPGWPALKKNKGLIGGPVYGNMIDYNRRVSAHTVVGSATKKGKEMDQYYMLTLRIETAGD